MTKTFAPVFTERTPGIEVVRPPTNEPTNIAIIKPKIPGAFTVKADAHAATAPRKKPPSMDKLNSPGRNKIITAIPVKIRGIIASITFPKRLKLIIGPRTKDCNAFNGSFDTRRIMAKTISKEIKIASTVRSISM